MSRHVYARVNHTGFLKAAGMATTVLSLRGLDERCFIVAGVRPYTSHQTTHAITYACV